MQQAFCHRWTLYTPVRYNALVLPDGCRDVIVRLTPGAAPATFITGLDQSAYHVEFNEGETLFGLRLPPGASFDERRLPPFGAGDADPEHLLHRAENAVTLPQASIAEALSLFSSAPCPVPTAAQTLGVSERTLRRTVTRATGWPPSQWLALARARRCARALARGEHPLAEAAADAGYADQAHMTRDMARWFGMTPRRLRDDRRVTNLLSQPGFG